MKKTNNKGFSLVELIIVIAIMAILAGAIAPALIRYIDKSRRSNDVTACKTIKTAVETALGNESIYEYLTTGDAADGDFCYVYVKPGEVTGADSSDVAIGADCISVTGAFETTDDDKINGKTSEELLALTQEEVATNIGEKTPKLKFRKAADEEIGVPSGFIAAISGGGTVYVFIATEGVTDEGFACTEDADSGEVETENGYQICPNVCDEYQ